MLIIIVSIAVGQGFVFFFKSTSDDVKRVCLLISFSPLCSDALKEALPLTKLLIFSYNPSSSIAPVWTSGGSQPLQMDFSSTISTIEKNTMRHCGTIRLGHLTRWPFIQCVEF